MKAIALAVLLLVGSAAYGQANTGVTTSAPAPGSVLQVVTPDTTNTRLNVEIGAVRLNTHSGRYTFAYLPLLPPLQGTTFRSSMEMPNAFALTGMSIPQRPRRSTKTLLDIR